MKKLLLLLCLTACGTEQRGTPGQDGTEGTPGPTGETGAQGPAGPVGQAGVNGTNGKDGKDYTPPKPVSLAGYFYLADDGFIELLEDADGRILINGTHKLFSKNSDGTYSLLPGLSSGPYTVHSGHVHVDTSLTYAAATNNAYVLATTTAIVGSRRTVVDFSRTTAGKLTIAVTVYSTTGLSIEYSRTITEKE